MRIGGSRNENSSGLHSMMNRTQTLRNEGKGTVKGIGKGSGFEKFVAQFTSKQPLDKSGLKSRNTGGCSSTLGNVSRGKSINLNSSIGRNSSKGGAMSF